MSFLVFGLVTALAVQEPAPQPDGELARLLLEDVRAWLRAGDLPAAEDLRALVAEAGSLSTNSDLAHELGNLGHRLGQAGRDEEARELIAWLGERALAAGDLATRSWSQDWLGQEAWVRGELDPAAGFLASAAEADARRGAVRERTRHLADVARIRLTQGRFEDARAEIRRAEEAAGSGAAARAVAEVHASLLFELGRHREALALCLGHASGTDGAPAARDETQVRLDILAADILADVGRLEAATTHARRAHETALSPEV